jgi:putative endonuclease
MNRKSWFLYILRNEKNALYTGITTDIDRRLSEHKSKTRKGAKFTRSCKDLSLVFQCEIGTQSQALKVEAKIKQLKKINKEKIITSTFTKKELFKYLSIK